MINSTMSLINQIYKKNRPLNILTCVAHERYEPNFAKCNVNIWALAKENNVRSWNTKYAPIPKNYSIISEKDIPSYIDFDLMISHNPFVHIPILARIRQSTNIPIINVFHTMPTPGWSEEHYNQVKGLFDLCQWHVCITEFNKLAWHLDGDNVSVIEHGMDTDEFDLGINKYKLVLTIANDFINRDWALGYYLWENIIKNGKFPFKIIGDTEGLSKPAKSTNEIIENHKRSLIYLNTSKYSPIPMSVLEAMSCGSCVVSTNTCALPDFIEHGKTGFLFNESYPKDFINCIHDLLNNPEKAIEIGQNARQKIIEKYHISRFVKEWNELLCRLVL